MAVGRDGPLAGTIGGGVAEAALVDRVAADLRAGSSDGAAGSDGAPAGRAGRLGDDLRRVTGGGRGPPERWRPAGCLSGGRRADRGDARDVVDRSGRLAGRERRCRLCGSRRLARAPRERPGRWAVRPHAARVGAGPSSGPTHVVHVVGRRPRRLGTGAPARRDWTSGWSWSTSAPGWRRRAVAPLTSASRVPYEELAEVVRAGSDQLRCDHGPLPRARCRRAGGARAARAGLPGPARQPREGAPDRRRPRRCRAWFHAPMGLPIGSATPAEIAVSVAAEMIAVRSALR